MSEREFVNSLFGGASDGFFRSSSVQLPLYCGPGQHHGASGTFAGGIPVPNPCLALTSPAIIGKILYSDVYRLLLLHKLRL